MKKLAKTNRKKTLSPSPRRKAKTAGGKASTPETASEPKKPLPPAHSAAEIAAVAAHLLHHVSLEIGVTTATAPQVAAARAVELLDAAADAEEQRETLRLMLANEPKPEHNIDFLEGLKRIPDLKRRKRRDRILPQFRRCWAWWRWSQSKQVSHRMADSTGDGAGTKQLTAKQREQGRTLEQEQWDAMVKGYWTPVTLARAIAVYEDWLQRGEPDARTEPGRPGTADVFGLKPYPPPTFGRAKEGALSASPAGADSPVSKKV